MYMGFVILSCVRACAQQNFVNMLRCQSLVKAMLSMHKLDQNNIFLRLKRNVLRLKRDKDFKLF